MARVAFATRVIDEAGNALGGSGTEVRIYDDFGATTATIVTADSGGLTTIAQPITPNAGTQTTLSVTTAVGDTTITVASTTGFAVGQLVPIYDGTNTRYRFITAILASPARLTLDSAIGVVFSSTNTSVGNPDMLGVVAGYVPDTTFHYIQTKDVASTRVMPPTLIPTMIGVQSLAVLEEGVAAGTRPTMNFIGPLITAVDNAPSTRVDVTVATPTAPVASAVGDTQATGTTTTVAAADHRHAREAFAALAAFAYAASNGTATTVPHSDHNHGLALTYSENALAADVLFSAANTYVDGPSLTLSAGTYFLSGQVTVFESGANYVTAKLWNGTTVEASGEAGTNIVNGTNYWTIPLTGVVVLAGSETWKISAASTTSSGQILAATPHNAAGNNASRLQAVRLA